MKTIDDKRINRLLARNGVRFGIYKNGTFNEQLFPFDSIARVITHLEFETLQAGLIQRVDALNAFLEDIYHDGNAVRDGVVPEEFVYSAKGYLPECADITPPGSIHSHISGIDLVQDVDGSWTILEDNLRIPSGASYPLIARELSRIASPETFREQSIVDNRDYGDMLREAMDYANPGGISVILTPGRYNAAYFEHSYLAEKTGALLVGSASLFVKNNKLYHKDYKGGEVRVGAVYRRISDEYLDPLTFLPESLIGVPGIMDAYRAGNVALLNAPGNGVADDKGIYYFVQAMIRYYLGEKAVLKNAPTYLPFFEKDMELVMDRLDELVVKDVAEAGGYGVVFGSSLNGEDLEKLRQAVIAEPRRFIAQEVVDFRDMDVKENGETVPRKADLRAFVVTGSETRVWASGLTRFSRDPDSCIVNSSQGGGFKDTWVLSR